jgi:SAM-dependent methyltransferase
MNSQFDPQRYWENRWEENKSLDPEYLTTFYRDIQKGPPFSTNQHRLRADHLQWLEETVAKHRWRTLLDAGCGPGFWFPLWEQLGIKAEAVDRTEIGLSAARAMIEAINADIPVHRSQLSALPFESKSFDVAVTVMVLLHTPPDDIRATMIELGRVAENLLLLEHKYPENAKLSPHVFDHDYIALAKELDYEIVTEIPRQREFGNEWLFVMRPRR